MFLLCLISLAFLGHAAALLFAGMVICHCICFAFVLSVVLLENRCDLFIFIWRIIFIEEELLYSSSEFDNQLNLIYG